MQLRVDTEFPELMTEIVRENIRKKKKGMTEIEAKKQISNKQDNKHYMEVPSNR